MALPAEISTFTATVSAPVTHAGGPLDMYVTLEPSAFLIHTATGIPLVDMLEELTLSPGVSGQFTLPHTDQDGFQDVSGNAYKNWFYTAKIYYGSPVKRRNRLPVTKVFQATVGQDVVDMDLLPSGAAAMPYTAPGATVAAFNGRTGAVTLEEADLPGRLSEASLSATYASEISTPGKPARAAVDGLATAAAAAAVAPVSARPTVTAVNPVRSVSDSIVHVRQGSANAVMLRQTDLTRQVAIFQNLGANDMMVAEGTNGSLAAPATGYVAVTAGQEYVTASTKPVFAYMSTTAATARVYCAQGV